MTEIRSIQQADSTNRVASEWAAQGADEWSVVVAEHQTAGRGRLDRTWYAPPGKALLFSVIVRPTSSEPALLNLAAAVAVCSVLRDRGFGAKVKWPNDVLIDGRKVAGILSEMRPSPTGDVAIVGVGLNVNIKEFPPELGAGATSLLLESGAPVERGPLLDEILAEFRTTAAAPATEMLDLYRKLCATLGKRVSIATGKGNLEGLAVDVDPAGALILEDGTLVTFGDVIHLR